MSKTDNRTIRISSIHRDNRFQVRVELDKIKVEQYKTALLAGATFPPIEIADVDGVPLLTDGWHRLAALEALGRTEVDANVTLATAREAAYMAVQANLRHGLPLRAADFRKAFRLYIKAKCHIKPPHGNFKSLRTIASELGGTRSHVTIHRWLQKEFPKIAEQFSAETPTGGKGNMTTARDVFKGNAKSTAEALYNARDTFTGIPKEADKRRIISLAEDILATMKAASEWREDSLADF